MDLGTHLASKLEPFVLMSKSAKGAAAAKLVQDATSAHGVYVFWRVARVAKYPGGTSQVEVTYGISGRCQSLFAYRTYQDYLQHRDALPQLSPTQITKLKHLSLVSFAMERRILPYSDLLQALQISTIRELEDLIIDAIYLDILRGKLDQKEQQFEVEYTMGRDLEPDKIGAVLRSLEDWCVRPFSLIPTVLTQRNAMHRSQTTGSVLTTLDNKLSSLSSQSVALALAEEDHTRILTTNLKDILEKQKENKAAGKRGMAGGSAFRKDRDDDMDVDDPAESSKGKNRKYVVPYDSLFTRAASYALQGIAGDGIQAAQQQTQ
ncbi:hypothetical protein EVG20_g1619 [Dentipellis fragilis]|uniref:PCI domain-containing protein n=1 Tax=Dentipellis fragilis TaxID=205917 RepID=A0A4Y9ZC54_9AGAM|nr:hypothetical protein EVG20_g1619 [Dentipellis fragilis]